MIYNDAQWELIKQASPHFETARRDYVRNAPRWLTEQTIRVYEDATGRTLMSKDLSCAVCVLHIYQAVGTTYFADLKERKKQEEENAKQPKSNTVGDAKSNRRNKKTNKRGS